MNVLIIGLPTSGASALYFSIKHAGSYDLSVSEILNSRQLSYFRMHPGPKIGNVQLPRLFRMNETLADDEQPILVARDPRDALVSWILSQPLLHGNRRNQDFLTELIDLLRKKENDPLGVSLEDLLGVCRAHGLRHQRPEHFQTIDLEDRLTASASNLVGIRYEDLVAGKTSELEGHLGFPVPRTELVEYKVLGSWRHWFTPEDVAVYRPILDPYLEKWRYGADDWDLSDQPRIDPRTSSEHIVQVLDTLEARPPAQGRLLRRELYDAARIDMLQRAADDHCEPSMIELALAYRDGYGIEADPAHGVALLREAAMSGNTRAMAHLSLALRHGVGTDNDDAAAAGEWERSAIEIVGPIKAGEELERARVGWQRAAERASRRSTVHRLLRRRWAAPVVRGMQRLAPRPQRNARERTSPAGVGRRSGSMLPPIIIGGMPRSGTSFLAALLNAHRELAITAEMNRHAAEALLELHEQLTTYMRRQEKRERVWNAKRGQFILDAWCNITNDKLFEGRVEPRIGHKTPGAEHLFERYERAFAPGRPVLLYCMREGLAVMRSVLNMPWNPVPLEERIEQYKSSVARFESLQARRPNRVRLFQIDRMPADASERQATIAELFAFLGHDVSADVRAFVDNWQPRNTRASWQGATKRDLTDDQLEALRADEEFMEIQRRYGYG